MNKQFIQNIILTDVLKTYHYRIILLLSIQECTQHMISDQLQIKKQNTYRYIKELLTWGIVELDRIEGRNKFYKLCFDTKELPMKGQLKI